MLPMLVNILCIITEYSLNIPYRFLGWSGTTAKDPFSMVKDAVWREVTKEHT
jgi:hypothetical protein